MTFDGELTSHCPNRGSHRLDQRLLDSWFGERRVTCAERGLGDWDPGHRLKKVCRALRRRRARTSTAQALLRSLRSLFFSLWAPMTFAVVGFVVVAGVVVLAVAVAVVFVALLAVLALRSRCGLCHLIHRGPLRRRDPIPQKIQLWITARLARTHGCRSGRENPEVSIIFDHALPQISQHESPRGLPHLAAKFPVALKRQSCPATPRVCHGPRRQRAAVHFVEVRGHGAFARLARSRASPALRDQRPTHRVLSRANFRAMPPVIFGRQLPCRKSSILFWHSWLGPTVMGDPGSGRQCQAVAERQKGVGWAAGSGFNRTSAGCGRGGVARRTKVFGMLWRRR